VNRNRIYEALVLASLVCVPQIAAAQSKAASVAPEAFGDPTPAALGDPRFAAQSYDSACTTLRLASTGGPLPVDSKTLVIRWLGYASYELTYGKQVILLDNYYERGPRYRYLGFHADDVKKADLIIVGHGHFDHMSDTAQIALQTGAPVVGAPITIAKLQTQSVPAAQQIQVTGTGNELLHFNGFTVQPILGIHGQPPSFTAAFGAAYTAAIPTPTPDEAAAEAAIRAKGSADSNITFQGTIAYIITFEDGFRLAYRDSGGVMSDYEKAAMAKIGRVDVLLGAISANIIAESQATVTMPMIANYRPDVFIPGHHEEEVGGKVDRATEPQFQYAKNVSPQTVMISKLYREPTCFDTSQNIASGTGLHISPY
jgi:L-ascorbate metabolism protein UlaG (beta-lactamase superfamily)